MTHTHTPPYIVCNGQNFIVVFAALQELPVSAHLFKTHVYFFLSVFNLKWERLPNIPIEIQKQKSTSPSILQLSNCPVVSSGYLNVVHKNALG